MSLSTTRELMKAQAEYAAARHHVALTEPGDLICYLCQTSWPCDLRVTAVTTVLWLEGMLPDLR